MRIPFVDLVARHAEVADAVEDGVLAVLRSGRWNGGPVVGEAEAIAAARLGRRGAVGVGSGTDALMLALQAVGVGPGDEVIAPAVTFFATAGAVRAIGADVVIADIGEDGLLDAESARSVLGPRTRAVIPVHLYGNVAPAPDLGVTVVDDAAQAIGADPAPGCGVLTTLSTYPTKTWGSAGDGGFVAGDDQALLDRVRRLGNHGAVEPHVHHAIEGRIGRATRLDAVAAAVLVAHASALDARIGRRRALARRYDAGLPGWATPAPRTPGSAVHQYCIRCSGMPRDAVSAGLAARGIATAVYYPKPLHHQPALAGVRAAPTPVADAWCADVLALPIADIGPAEVDAVLTAMAELRP